MAPDFVESIPGYWVSANAEPPQPKTEVTLGEYLGTDKAPSIEDARTFDMALRLLPAEVRGLRAALQVRV